MHLTQHLQRLLSSAVFFRREICGPNFRFSVEIAEVSTNFDAIFARETRPAPAEPLQKLQACDAQRAKHMDNFCAPFSRVSRTFGTEIAQFCGRISHDFACKTLKISAIAATDARTRRKKDIDDHYTHDAQDTQVFLSSAMIVAAKFCIHQP